jgi:hypothetical protein
MLKVERKGAKSSTEEIRNQAVNYYIGVCGEAGGVRKGAGVYRGSATYRRRAEHRPELCEIQTGARVPDLHAFGMCPQPNALGPD